jgi:hypothetical protein
MPTPDRCPARYEREGGRDPGDRIVECHLEAGHPGEHEEEGTEVTWLPDEPDDHDRFREQALADPATREAYIKARVDAAYRRGLTDLLGYAARVFFGRRLDLVGIDRESAEVMIVLALDEARQIGRTQATEGWEREWGTDEEGVRVRPASDEETARFVVARYRPGHRVVSRLVGPWESAEQPEPAGKPEDGEGRG